MIKLLHQDATSNVVHNRRITDPINICMGVRHIYIILDDFMRKFAVHTNGISWTLKRKVELSHIFEDMQSMLSILNDETNLISLKVDIKKTKFMAASI